MEHDRPWVRLIEYVDEWASVREVSGGIEVTFETTPGVSRTVEVVVTESQWDDYVSTVFGTRDPRLTPIRRHVLATPETVRFLVYDTYDWLPSESRELAEGEMNPGPGEWVVEDTEGNDLLDVVRKVAEGLTNRQIGEQGA